MLLATEVAAGSSAANSASALVMIFNAAAQVVEFTLPASQFSWHCIFTTADAEQSVSLEGVTLIDARSVQLFVLQNPA